MKNHKYLSSSSHDKGSLELKFLPATLKSDTHTNQALSKA